MENQTTNFYDSLSLIRRMAEIAIHRGRFVGIATLVAGTILLVIFWGTPASMALDKDDVGAVGIAVEIKLGNRNVRPRIVMFAQLDDRGRWDKVRELIPATKMESNRAYLLNVPKGRYVAVAVAYDLEPPDSDTQPFELDVDLSGGLIFLPRNAIKQSEVEVTSNDLAFMGRFLLATETFSPQKAGPAQSHFAEVVESEYGTEVDAENALLARLKGVLQDKKTEHEFLEAARADLPGTGWLPVIRLQLETLEQSDQAAGEKPEK